MRLRASIIFATLETNSVNPSPEMTAYKPRMNEKGAMSRAALWGVTKAPMPFAVTVRRQFGILPRLRHVQAATPENRVPPFAIPCGDDPIGTLPMGLIIEFTQIGKILTFPIPSRIRLVQTDGRVFPEEVPPSYRGDSVGRWEGDVFVVATKTFNDDTWIWTEGRRIPISCGRRSSRPG